MDKIIHRISFIISAVLIYVFGAYTYLTYKGFVYENGSFVLISDAKAGFFDNKEAFLEQEAPFASEVDRKTALNLPENLIAGDKATPLMIYEFSSLGCTHCADFHLNMLPKLDKNYIKEGKLGVTFVHFPLDKRSMQAAMIAECLDEEKKADFINLVFSKQREWVLAADATNYLTNYGIMSGLSAADVAHCLKNDDIAKEIIFNRQEAIDKLAIQGTPAFLVVGADKNEIIYGVSNINELKAYLDKRLNEIEAFRLKQDALLSDDE